MLAGLGALIAWPALAACGDAESPEAAAPGAGGTIELLLQRPATIDPALATEPNELTIVQALFEPLLTVGAGGVLAPAVAESWQITDDGRAYTFKLRPEARWTNGDAVTADDFVWAWQRNLSPLVGGAFNYLMFPIRGAEHFANGLNTAVETIAVTAPEPSTLHVRLEQPTPGFLARLAMATFYPLPRAEIEAVGDAWTSVRNLRSNGAFQLARWDRLQGMTLVPNEHYWGPAARFREVSVRFSQDGESRISAFRSGTVDVAQLWGAEYQAARADDQTRKQLRLFERAGSWFIVLNTAKFPWNRPEVRRALSLALDRPALVAAVFDEPTLPAWTIAPPSILGREATPQTADAEAARSLLAQAGFPNGEGFPVARFTYHRTETWQRLAGELSRRWEATLGIRVVPEEREWRDFLAFTDDPGDFDMYRAGWTSEYLDPSNWYDELWRSDRDYLRARWSNAEFDTQLETAANARDPAERAAAYAVAAALLQDEAPAIPIAYRASAFLLQPAVSAFRIDEVTGAIDLGSTALG